MRNRLLRRLLGLGIPATVLPLVLLTLLAWHYNTRTKAAARAGCERLSFDTIDLALRNADAACETYRLALADQVNTSLRVARSTLDRQGGVALSPTARVDWDAVNQISKEAARQSLPQLMVGATAITRIDDPGAPVPFVDDVKGQVGGTCTLFQRLNERGDMLRVATNVINASQKRAVGTFIPATNPDGQPNPVLASVLKGQTYVGRAFVVDGWYSTGYEPLKDKSGNVIGMLYVGTPEAQATASLKTMMRGIRIARTGHLTVINTKGDSRGNVVLWTEQTREGQNALADTDHAGGKFVEELATRGASLTRGQSAQYAYPWKKDAAPPQTRFVRMARYEPWDWLIVANLDENELYETANQIDTLAYAGQRMQWIVAAIATLIAVVVWVFVARSLGNRLRRTAESIGTACAELQSAAQSLNSSSQLVAEGASKQAASLEEATASLTEIGAMTTRSAEVTQQATSLSSQASAAAKAGNTSMGNMSQAISQIQKGAEETARIIKVINEIAFQTNLLALNAAVEAARAGEAGKGFAVVAAEVRNLALRCADAARDTSDLIEKSVANAQGGAKISGEVEASLHRIAESSSKLDALISEVASASTEQAQGVRQVSEAVTEIDRITQRNAAEAESSASASQELSAQVRQLHTTVGDLNDLVGCGAN